MSNHETLPFAKSAALRLDEAGQCRLLVLGEGLLATHQLPAAGTVAIGRADDADIQIDDRSVSRRHCLLHLGEVLRVEDLGSANGTCVRGSKLELRHPVEVGPGDPIEVGSCLVVVQRGAATAHGHAMRLGQSVPFVVHDDAMQRLHQLVDRIAQSNINVLLLGESGVGKEVLSAELHRRSRRNNGPFLKLNCAALTETLLESELFGHEKGAFTGAVRTKPGLLETAEHGTVLLDEVGELPASLQAKLLRVLEERRVLRVGGLQPVPIDVRFVFATNRDLEGEVSRGNFRQDLYYRLNGISVVIPPLRERPSEIEALARQFLNEAAKKEGLPRPPEMTNTALERLKRHTWPGNIRELRNTIDRAVVLCSTGPIEPEHLVLQPPRPLSTPPPPKAVAPPPIDLPPSPTGLSSPSLTPVPGALRDERDAAEQRAIVEALERCGGNQTKAAAFLGISRRTLVTRLQNYGLTRSRKKR
jgi:two-component system response regulator AtoC